MGGCDFRIRWALSLTSPRVRAAARTRYRNAGIVDLLIPYLLQ